MAAVIAGMIGLLLWYHRRITGVDVQISWFAAVLLAALTYTLLQIVPLPLSILRWLAPATVEVLEVSLNVAGGLSSWHPISLDPPATLMEAIKLGTCVLTFIVADNYAYRSDRRLRLLRVLILVGVTVVFLGFIGAVAAPGKPLMFFEPAEGAARGMIVTSFVNPNHGAAFLIICSLLAAGLAMWEHDLQIKVALGIAAAVLGAGVFLTLSRGGMLALAIGLAALAALVGFRPASSRSRRRWPLVAVLGVVALISGLAVFLAYDAVMAEFKYTVHQGTTNLGKVGLWASGWAMVEANPWMGTGRGSFFTAFPRYLSAESANLFTYSHLENQYLHLPAEWGVVVGWGVILASAVALGIWAYRQRRDYLSLATAASLLALAAHSLFDFSMEILGLALPASALAGMLSARASLKNSSSNAGKPSRSSARLRSIGRGKKAMLLLVLAVGVLVLTVFAASGRMPSVLQDEAELIRLSGQGVSTKQFLESTREAIRRHPADYMLHFTAARWLMRTQGTEALAWLNRALFLFPHSPKLHEATARTLNKLGYRSQALLESRMAMQCGRDPHWELRWALPLCTSIKDIERLIPREDAQIHRIAVNLLLQARRGELALQTARLGLIRRGTSVELKAVEIKALLAVKHDEQAESLARALAENQNQPQHYRLWATAAERIRGPAAAIKVLGLARKRMPHRADITYALAEMRFKNNELPRARQLTEQILKNCVDRQMLARAHALLARIYRADGRIHRALLEDREAQKLRH